MVVSIVSVQIHCKAYPANRTSTSAREGVPAISGVDTREVVTYLREQGSSLARITIGEEYDADEDEAYVVSSL